MLIASNIYVRHKSYKVDRAPTTAHVINSTPVSTARFCVVNTAREKKRRERFRKKSDRSARRTAARSNIVNFCRDLSGRYLSFVYGFIFYRILEIRLFLLETSSTRCFELRIFWKFDSILRERERETCISQKNQISIILISLKVGNCKRSENV